MGTLFKFNRFYFLLTLLLFITEVLIAVYVHDAFIRPYFGDFLVVMLIYCFCRSFLNTPPGKTALAVLLFAYAIEVSQYFNLVDKIGLGHCKLARVVLGSSFAWIDMVAYTAGFIFVILVERWRLKESL